MQILNKPAAVPHPGHLANTWVVPLGTSGRCVLVDAGGPLEETRALLELHDLTPVWVLLTHHHYDHVTHAQWFRENSGASLAIHPFEAGLISMEPEVGAEEGTRVDLGEGRWAEAWHIPGHTRGQLAWHLQGIGVFTGDTLFKASIGGCRGPGHGSYLELAKSLERLAKLPEDTALYPGHGPATTVGEELRDNPLLRLVLGLDQAGDTPAVARGESCTLLLQARDYDGGTKAVVQWPNGQRDVVPGSWIGRDH